MLSFSLFLFLRILQFSQKTLCHSRNAQVEMIKSMIVELHSVVYFQSACILHAGIYSHYHGLLVQLNRTEPVLMLVIFFLLWQFSCEKGQLLKSRLVLQSSLKKTSNTKRSFFLIFFRDRWSEDLASQPHLSSPEHSDKELEDREEELENEEDREEHIYHTLDRQEDCSIIEPVYALPLKVRLRGTCQS